MNACRTHIHDCGGNGIHVSRRAKVVVEECEIWECGKPVLACTNRGSLHVAKTTVRDSKNGGLYVNESLCEALNCTFIRLEGRAIACEDASASVEVIQTQIQECASGAFIGAGASRRQPGIALV
jgi:hypothetical protein